MTSPSERHGALYNVLVLEIPVGPEPRNSMMIVSGRWVESNLEVYRKSFQSNITACNGCIIIVLNSECYRFEPSFAFLLPPVQTPVLVLLSIDQRAMPLIVALAFLSHAGRTDFHRLVDVSAGADIVARHVTVPRPWNMELLIASSCPVL